jgi:hypothetical protein
MSTMGERDSNRRPIIRDMIPLAHGRTEPGFKEVLTGADCFAFDVMVFIGLDDEDDSDRFDCFACSPQWLADNFFALHSKTGERMLPWANIEAEEKGALFVPSLVLMPAWDAEVLRRAIEEICERCSGPDWPTVASRLDRYLDWEWEYNYDEFVDRHAEKFELPRDWIASSYE